LRHHDSISSTGLRDQTRTSPGAALSKKYRQHFERGSALLLSGADTLRHMAVEFSTKMGDQTNFFARKRAERPRMLAKRDFANCAAK
jgi:hypothetical protein